MTLPVYFLSPPACGWYCGNHGTLIGPDVQAHSPVLAFDDRNPILEAHLHSLLDAVLQAASRNESQILFLDFERSPTPASMELVRMAASQMRTAAPLAYCEGSKAEPLVCYHPVKELFADFMNRLPASCWLELWPIQEEVFYPAQRTEHFAEDASFFSEVLQCHYRMEETVQGLRLRFYDTAQSFANRGSMLSTKLCGAIALKAELADYDFPPDWEIA